MSDDLEAKLTAAMARPDGPQIRPSGTFAYTWADICEAAALGAKAREEEIVRWLNLESPLSSPPTLADLIAAGAGRSKP